MLSRLLRAGSRWVTHQRVEPSSPGQGLDADRSVWITWEQQRRTTELAGRFGISLERFLYRGPSLFRYSVLAGHTWECVLRRRPQFLVIQNPSLILAVLAVLIKKIMGLTLVVDRHTNFGINQPASLKKSVFSWLSRFSLRHADLTIVTNRHLADVVEASGGRGFVLPDPIPELPAGGSYPLAGDRNVCFICTYADDEPYAEFLRVVGDLPEGVHAYVTGNPARGEWTDELVAVKERTDNLTLTGFIDEDAYVALLQGSDVIVDLTTFDHCLVCGAYEAVAAERTVVLSDKQANRDLFGEIPVFVEPHGSDILRGVRQALDEAPQRAAAVRDFRPQYEASWDATWQELVGRIRGLG